MKPYHRLDLGIDFIRKRKHWTRTFSLGAYNVYSRKNPFYMNVETWYGGGNYENSPPEVSKVLVQYSLFPIIPYFNLNFKF